MGAFLCEKTMHHSLKPAPHAGLQPGRQDLATHILGSQMHVLYKSVTIKKGGKNSLKYCCNKEMVYNPLFPFIYVYTHISLT